MSNNKSVARYPRRGSRIVTCAPAKILGTLEALESRCLLSAVLTAEDPFLVNSYTTNAQNTASIAMRPTGEFVVVWQSTNQDTDASDGIFGQRYDANGQADGGEFHINTYTSGLQQSPSVAIASDGKFVVVWQGGPRTDGDNAQFGIYGQRFGVDGTPVGLEFQVNTTTTGVQQNPSVGIDSAGNFVVTWQSNGQDGSLDGVYAQRYNSGGVAQGGETLVNQYTTSSQAQPSVAMDANGDYVVAWTSYNQASTQSGSSQWDIFARQFALDGTPLTNEFQVNVFTVGAQKLPAVGMSSTGAFVISWDSNFQDGANYGVYARRYSAAASPLDDPFQVNTYTTNQQRTSAVAVDPSGDFVIAWNSFGQDGSLYGVYAQRYNAAGAAIGGETRVNSYTTSGQLNPSVAVDSLGEFTIVFQSTNGQDGSSDGVYARRYVAGAATPPVAANGNFVWQNAPQRIEIGFDQDVSASLGSDDLLLENLTAATTIDPVDVTVSYDLNTNIATFEWPGISGGVLSNGKYRATLQAAGITGISGVAMTNSYSFEFHFVNGDSNHDGTVDITDLASLATNWQTSVTSYGSGDFNYDGTVDITDLAILATNWQYTLPLPAAPTLFSPRPVNRPVDVRRAQVVEAAGTVDAAVRR